MKKLFIPTLAVAALLVGCSNSGSSEPEACTVDSCDSSGKLVKCVNGLTQSPQSCPADQTCFKDACIDNSSLTCVEDSCDNESNLIVCKNGKMSPPVACEGSLVCNGGKCTDPGGVRTEAEEALIACDVPKALDKLQSLKDRNNEEELARLVASTIMLIDDPAIKSLVKRVGFIADDSSWIYKKGGYIETLKTVTKYDACEAWIDNFEKEVFDTGRYDKTITVREIIDAVKILSPKLTSYANGYAALADKIDSPISISIAGCALNLLKFSKEELYLIAADLQFIAALASYADNYEWQDLTVFELGKAGDDLGSECELFDNKLCFWEMEDAQEAHARLSKLNTLLFVQAGTAPDNTALSGLVASAFSNIAKATKQTAGKGDFFDLSEISDGVRSDIHGISAAAADSLKFNSSIDLNMWLSGFKFDLGRLINQPIYRNPDDPLYVLGTVGSFKAYPEDSYDSYGFDYSVKVKSVVDQFNALWEPALMSVTSGNANEHDTVELTSQAEDNSKLSSGWTEDEDGDATAEGLILYDLLIPDEIILSCGDLWD